MKREEESRQLGRKVKRIRGKGKKEPILRTVIKDRNGIEKELNTQSSLVSAIAASNKKRQQQTNTRTTSLREIFYTRMLFLFLAGLP